MNYNRNMIELVVFFLYSDASRSTGRLPTRVTILLFRTADQNFSFRICIIHDQFSNVWRLNTAGSRILNSVDLGCI